MRLLSGRNIIDMDVHFIKDVKNPVNKSDAVNKAYFVRINIKQSLVIFLILLCQTIRYSHFPPRQLLQVER